MKILLLEKFETPTTDRYRVEAEKLGHTLTYAHYSSLRFEVNTALYGFVGDANLADFDVIYLRSIQGYEKIATLVVLFANHHQIKIYDTVLNQSLTWIDCKSYEHFQLVKNGLPVIPTTIGLGKSILNDNPIWPIIIKRGSVNQGEGVFLCHDLSEARNIATKFDHEILLREPFLENDGDVRVIVIGDKVVAAMHRSRQNQSEFRNNVSLGGEAKSFTLTPEVESLALRAAKAVGYDIAGVDLIFDQKNKKWLVMEVNRSPQYKGIEASTGKNIVEAVVQLITKQGD